VLRELMSSFGKGQPQGRTADREQSGSRVSDDEVDETEIYQRMMDKLLAMADDVLAAGWGETLPHSAAAIQRQRLTTRGDEDEEDKASIRGAQCTCHQLLNTTYVCLTMTYQFSAHGELPSAFRILSLLTHAQNGSRMWVDVAVSISTDNDSNCCW